jgi:hypothetical protein
LLSSFWQADGLFKLFLAFLVKVCAFNAPTAFTDVGVRTQLLMCMFMVSALAKQLRFMWLQVQRLENPNYGNETE